MNTRKIRVRELAAWDLDADEYRPKISNNDQPDRARAFVARRPPVEPQSALCELNDISLQALFAEQQSRPDLQKEMAGLDWSLGVVDLRHLLAFQRRLALNPNTSTISIPVADDWCALMELCFRVPNPITCEIVSYKDSFLLRSDNPNLHLRISRDAANPFLVHGGSPFFEVAQYGGRWFLRDGYHRAFALLRAGIFRVPAVVVQARTLEELGAVHPWFFSEEVLFSSSPPRVTDFLEDALVIEYDRSPLIKTVRVTVEETYSLAGEGL